MTLNNALSKVKVNNCISPPFTGGKGLGQWNPLSATIFDIVLEQVIRKTEINRTSRILILNVYFT